MPRLALSLLAVLMLGQLAAAAPSSYQYDRNTPVYRQLDALARQGLVEGYAAAPLAGPASLTKAEAASLTLRAIRGVAAQYALRGIELAQAVGAEAPVTPPAETPAATVRPEDLARLEKLIEELRTELVSQGADVAALTTTVTQLKAGMAALQKDVAGLSDELRRHHLSGYLQARYVLDQAKTPESTFTVRRAYLTLSGPVSQRTKYFLQIDALGAQDEGDSQVLVNEVTISHLVGNDTWVVAGQLAVPFGFDLGYSSALREMPERTTGVRSLFRDQIWDRGLMLTSDRAEWQWSAAVINGTGTVGNDTNDRKDVVLSARGQTGRLAGGGSVYFGREGATGAPQATKNLYDLWAQYDLSKAAYLRGELILGRAPDLTNLPAGAHPVSSWYVLGGYRPCPKTLLAARYDRFDPNLDLAGDALGTTTLAILHWLDPQTRLRLAQEFRPGDAGVFTGELQVSY